MAPETPAAASAPARQIRDPFVNVTPAGLSSGSAGEAQVVESFAGRLFMGVISYDPASRVDLRRVLRFEGPDKDWTTVHRHSVSAGSHDEPPAADGAEGASVEAAAAAAVMPGPGSSELFMRLSSPLATHALLTRDGKEFIPVAATSSEVFEAFSLRQVARSPSHHFAVSLFAGRPHLRLAPAAGDRTSWRELALPQRADGGEASVGSLAVFGEHLVVGANDPERGFELYRLADAGSPAWEPKIVRGAHRFSTNAAVLALLPWNDALYLVTGRLAGSPKERPWIPRGFEIIRVYPDFSWDLIAGTPRVTDSGLKIPLAGLAPGFDDFRPADFRCLAVHGDEMLLGTYEDVEGFRVWSTHDGEQWSTIPHIELSGYGNVGAARFHPTDAGVVLELVVDDPVRGRKISLWLRQDA